MDAGLNADAELADALRRGDAAAFDRLLEQRWARLVAYLEPRLGDVETAQDVAQEAFIRLWEHRRNLDATHSPLAYLYQTARHLAIDELRRRDVRARWETLERNSAPAAVPPAQLRLSEDRECLVALERAVAGLSERRREAFILVHVQGLSYRQAAGAMGTAPQTVANQVAGALAELRLALRPLVEERADRPR